MWKIEKQLSSQISSGVTWTWCSPKKRWSGSTKRTAAVGLKEIWPWPRHSQSYRVGCYQPAPHMECQQLSWGDGFKNDGRSLYTWWFWTFTGRCENQGICWWLAFQVSIARFDCWRIWHWTGVNAPRSIIMQTRAPILGYQCKSTVTPLGYTLIWGYLRLAIGARAHSRSLSFSSASNTIITRANNQALNSAAQRLSCSFLPCSAALNSCPRWCQPDQSSPLVVVASSKMQGKIGTGSPHVSCEYIHEHIVLQGFPRQIPQATESTLPFPEIWESNSFMSSSPSRWAMTTAATALPQMLVRDRHSDMNLSSWPGKTRHASHPPKEKYINWKRFKLQPYNLVELTILSILFQNYYRWMRCKCITWMMYSNTLKPSGIDNQKKTRLMYANVRACGQTHGKWSKWGDGQIVHQAFIPGPGTLVTAVPGQGAIPRTMAIPGTSSCPSASGSSQWIQGWDTLG